MRLADEILEMICDGHATALRTAACQSKEFSKSDQEDANYLQASQVLACHVGFLLAIGCKGYLDLGMENEMGWVLSITKLTWA